MSSEEQPELGEIKIEQHEGLSDVMNAFISYFRVTGDIRVSAKLAGCAKGTHYFWMSTTPAYKKAWESCRSTIAAMVEDSLVPKLIDGWDEPVYQGGELVGHKRKFDLAAMQRYLAKAKPEVFGDKIEIDASIKPVSPAEMLAALAGTVPYAEEENGLPSDDAHLDGDSASDTEEAV